MTSEWWRRAGISAAFVVASFAAAHACSSEVADQAVIYEGGEVWSGERFERRDLAVRGGFFIESNQAGTGAARVDVSGKYLTPAYANAHHHLTGASDKAGWSFMEHGVFYVWNPNLISTAWSADAAEYFAREDTYDVRVSMGGMTEPGGHPEKLYVDALSRHVYKGLGYKDFYGTAFHYGRTSEEIDCSLDLLQSQGAHFVKALLLYSEDYEKRKNDDAYYGLKGLNPANMAYLVKAAHDRDLPVAVHVETSHDARVAIDAGADMLAHLPGYVATPGDNMLERKALTAEDAEELAKRRILTVPTYALAAYFYKTREEEEKEKFDETDRDRHFALQASNLRFLSEAEVIMLTGTDAAASIIDEVTHWVEIGGLSHQEALKSVYQTGRYLFPDKKIGRLETGYEADFLVLNADPTEDIKNLTAIDVRVKGGGVIEAPEE